MTGGSGLWPGRCTTASAWHGAPCTACRGATAPRRPLGAGLVSGVALSLVVDEGLTPALGLSAPNRAYPAATHVRGFLAHLVWGAAAALAAEAIYRVTNTTPDHAGPPAGRCRLAGRATPA